MNFLSKLVARLVLFVINTFVQLVHVPAHFHNFLKDHAGVYRQLRGGVWLKWNGFWEKADAEGNAIFRRGYAGLDLADGGIKWSYSQLMKLGDSVIAAVEDYTKKQS
jgi:hypothetical protein